MKLIFLVLLAIISGLVLMSLEPPFLVGGFALMVVLWGASKGLDSVFPEKKKN